MNRAAESLHVVDVIAALDASLARSGASASTRRQRRWALTEGARYAAKATGIHVSRVTIGVLLRPDILAQWFAEAASGSTRVRGAVDQAADASMRARRASLTALAAHLGLPSPQLSVASVSVGDRWTKAQAMAAIRRLLAGPPPGTTRASWARTAALAALAVDTGERIGVLYGLAVADVDLRRAGVSIDSHPIPMSPTTTAAVTTWLAERARIVAELEGSEPPQLWVSTHLVIAGSGPAARRRTAGLPLTVRALHQSHRRCLQRLVAAGHPAELLRLGQLRPAE
jgi:integrase